MISRSKVIRFTLPISGQLSQHLSVMAWHADLTRQQYARRALEAYMADQLARWAALSDVTPEQWLADATSAWQGWRGKQAAYRSNPQAVDDIAPRQEEA